MSTNIPALQIPFLVAAGSGNPDLAYARLSVPLPRGEWRGDIPVQIRSSDGSLLPCQAWPLGTWPDQSIRMLHLIAPLANGAYTVETGENAPLIEAPMTVEEDKDGGVEIRHGENRFCFTNDQLIAGAYRGQTAILDGGSLEVCVTPASGVPFVTTLEDRPRVIRSGPLYTVVERWVRAAAAEGDGGLRFRFQFEFFAGIPGMTCSVMLVNDTPGADFQDFRSIKLAFQLAGPSATSHAVYQQSYGFEYVHNRFAETTNALDVRVDHTKFHAYVANYDALEDPHVYAHYLRPPPDVVGNAVFLREGERVLQLEMEDFNLLRPKGVQLQDGKATFALWPEWADPLQLQQGRRRQVKFALFMGHHEVPHRGIKGVTMEAASDVLLNHYRCQLLPETYAAARFFDQERVLAFRPDRYPRMEGWLSAVSKLRTAADFFDLGDTHDSGYATTYRPLAYTQPRKGGNPRQSTFFLTPHYPRRPECHEHLDDYEPVWINNEYDVLYCLGTEALRRSNLWLMHQLRWFARHTIEVDFICYSDHPLHHRAQPPHCERHTSAGAYPSHFWTQGLAQYYFLTGDEDALDVIAGLADKTIWYFEHPTFGLLNTGVNREIGWGVLTLVSAYEATGDKKYDLYARHLIDLLMAEPMPEDLPVFNFGQTSFFLACRSYIQLHDDEEVTAPVLKWYLDWLRLAIRCAEAPPNYQAGAAEKPKLSDNAIFQSLGAGRYMPRPGVLSSYAVADCLAFAYEKTGDKTFLRAGVRALMALLDGNPGYGNFSYHQPNPEGKEFAWVYRTWISYLGALDRAGWLPEFDYRSPEFPG